MFGSPTYCGWGASIMARANDAAASCCAAIIYAGLSLCDARTSTLPIHRPGNSHTARAPLVPPNTHARQAAATAQYTCGQEGLRNSPTLISTLHQCLPISWAGARRPSLTSARDLTSASGRTRRAPSARNATRQGTGHTSARQRLGPIRSARAGPPF